MSAHRPYQPIDCSLHDHLESAATLRRPVIIAYRTAQDDLAQLEDRIIDVFARDGVEFLKVGSGAEIRLDDVVSVDGVKFTNG